MDLWDWVHVVEDDLRDAGEHELADFIDRISTDTCDGRHDEVDQYAEEAIAKARELKLGWVEVFLRHWRLQSTVLRRAKPKDMIKEAVSLLEFSSREENSDCPQSVCVVQDLASCYGCIDGAGFAEERIAVAVESLAKINPHWDCFACIAQEHAEALFDLGDFDGCLVYLDRIDQDMAKSDQPKDTAHLLLIRVRVLIAQEKLELAGRLLKKANCWGGGDTFIVEKNIYQSLYLASSGFYKEAMESLPLYSEVRKVPAAYYLWCQVIKLSMDGDENYLNKDNIRKLQVVIKDMIERGVFRQSFNILSWLVAYGDNNELGVNPSEIIVSMGEIAENFKRDRGAIKTLREMRDLIAKNS